MMIADEAAAVAAKAEADKHLFICQRRLIQLSQPLVFFEMFGRNLIECDRRVAGLKKIN